MKGFNSDCGCLSCDLFGEHQRQLGGLYAAKPDHMNSCLMTDEALITLTLIVSVIIFSKC